MPRLTGVGILLALIGPVSGDVVREETTRTHAPALFPKDALTYFNKHGGCFNLEKNTAVAAKGIEGDRVLIRPVVYRFSLGRPVAILAAEKAVLIRWCPSDRTASIRFHTGALLAEDTAIQFEEHVLVTTILAQ